MYSQIYEDTARQWRWRLRPGNHEIIAHGESYSNKCDCLHAIGLVKSRNALRPGREV